MSNLWIALVLGLVFGFLLNKAGLTSYHKIVNVFRLTDMAVLKFMMSGLAVAMVGLYAMRGLGWITFPAGPPGWGGCLWVDLRDRLPADLAPGRLRQRHPRSAVERQQLAAHRCLCRHERVPVLPDRPRPDPQGSADPG